MNISERVSSYIGGVEFGFLSDKEILSLSVTTVTNPVTFDSLLHPNDGGLYDTRLGSWQNGFCKTCRLKGTDGCPGHCGHIDLPVRVYHPIYIDQLLRLLRAKCVFCHHFRLKRHDMNLYISKLSLLNVGLVKQAQDIDREVGYILSKTAGHGDSSADEEDAESSGIIEAQRTYVKRMLRELRRNTGTKHSQVTETAAEARKVVVKEFMTKCALDRPCATCKGRSPTFRKERSVKMFMKGMNRKQMGHNAALDLKMQNPLGLISRRRAAEQSAAEAKVKPKIDLDNPSFSTNYAVGGASDTSSDNGRSEAADSSADEIEEDLLLSKVQGEGLGSKTDVEGSSKTEDTFFGAEEVYAAMTLLFEHESAILRLLYSPKSKADDVDALSADMFFIKRLLVPPSRFRPENPGDGDSVTEHSRNSLYKAILVENQKIQQIHLEILGKKAPLSGRAPRGERDLKLAQIELQEVVNALIDTGASKFSNDARQVEGIKQTLEKKEGLFRQNMMGKRVNFAGRSVISPDPNIETNEIGVPPIFATRLTYPEPLTQQNYFELRQAVINGPHIWPGAVAIEAEDGKILALIGRTTEERKTIANQLLAKQGVEGGRPASKKVHRHLVNGDIVIMNRQPTLHKPSMMCHRVRVLVGEKTIRMHYANCKTYNADFDGDEMNMHFPQNEMARAEANLIADTDHQYLSATAGKPLRGLIQDHISVSVRMSSRDSFFGRDDYYQLVYAALRPENGHTVSGTLEVVAPAILKPIPLWTGKQLVTTILKNLTPETFPGLSMDSKTATAGSRWGSAAFEDEAKVLFVEGEFIHGIIDNKQIGPNGGGLIHGVYETLGPTIAGKLLSTFGRLLTKLLHMQAVSCGVQDLILTGEGEATRRELLKKAKVIGLEVAAAYVTLEKQKPTQDDPEFLRRMEDVLREDEKQKGLDEVSKQNGNLLSSEVTKACLPNHLIKQFPKNQMQLMTGTGAKGSVVNANLISCNLGQQVLEGRRVPTMISGKTLPCFKPFDPSLRAGGYIQDRFLTGVNPQEYYFHAMAGREGLIDTAVKTSRSGYLQRCLVKGMEGLQVSYDCSVRDSSDGSIVQFLYGEDGLDTTKSIFMNNFKFTVQNFLSLYSSLNVHEEYNKVHNTEATKHNKKVSKKPKDKDPATSIWNPAAHAGSMSEKFYRAVDKYVKENPDKLILNKEKGISGIAEKAFKCLTEMQYIKSLAEAGEAVGIVAAQSVGEPSTQMTLNTFHLAGHSSKNVTLGIPRLREIVMTASAHIATPMMTLHLHDFVTPDEGEKFAKELSRLSLSEVVDSTSVVEQIGKGKAYSYAKIYKIRFDFFPPKEYQVEYSIVVQQVLETIATKFLPDLCRKIFREFKRKNPKVKGAVVDDALPELGASAGRSEEHGGAAARRRGEDDSDEDSSGDEAGEDMDADTAKRKMKQSEMKDWGEAEDEEDAEVASQVSDEVGDDVDEEDNKTAKMSDKEKELRDYDSDDSDRSLAEMYDEDFITHTPDEILRFVQGQKSNDSITAFTFDPKGKYCEATLEYSASSPKLLMLQMVESITRSTVIQATPLIGACLYEAKNQYEDPVTGESTLEPAIITEGCNLKAMRDHQEYINCNKMFTNDIYAMLEIYGVEACRATIVREMHAVFAGHAIDVNQRHLNLIADTMTRNGRYLPFSRNGMKNAVSAFMKMSFETTVGFLKEATLGQEEETLTNPSARIVVGSLSKVGTGSFDLFVPTDGSAMARDDSSDEN